MANLKTKILYGIIVCSVILFMIYQITKQDESPNSVTSENKKLQTATAPNTSFTLYNYYKIPIVVKITSPGGISISENAKASGKTLIPLDKVQGLIDSGTIIHAYASHTGNNPNGNNPNSGNPKSTSEWL